MHRYDLITPEGTKDFLFEECDRKRMVERHTRDLFKSMGYHRVITPGLEFYDVFCQDVHRFSQEELCKLTDYRGRLMAVRPDSTMPIARVAATRLKDAQLPLRLYYTQPVYRFESSLKGHRVEINQTGIELIGSSSRMADIEVISAAVSVLSSAGEEIPGDTEIQYSLELGDVRIFQELMKRLEIPSALKLEIHSLIDSKNYPALGDLLDRMEDTPLTRALRKLPTLFGREEVFEKASALFQDDKMQSILDELQEVYRAVCRLTEKENVLVDLGLLNKNDYYTGIVLKGYLEGYGEEVISGGRYDTLLADFGYDVPAVGMAVNVDAVADVLGRRMTPRPSPPDVLMVAAPGQEAAAVQKARALREQGLCCEHFLEGDLSPAAYARKKGIPKIVTVTADGTEEVDVCE